MRIEVKPSEGEMLFKQAKERREAAIRAFDNSNDPLLTEAAIYEFRAATANMSYALKLLRDLTDTKKHKCANARK